MKRAKTGEILRKSGKGPINDYDVEGQALSEGQDSPPTEELSVEQGTATPNLEAYFRLMRTPPEVQLRLCSTFATYLRAMLKAREH